MSDMRLSLHTVSLPTREAGALPPSLAGDHSGRRVRPLPGGRVRVTQSQVLRDGCVCDARTLALPCPLARTDSVVCDVRAGCTRRRL